MAQQPVTSPGYPYVQARFIIRGIQYSHLALVDTGFSGELAIPGQILGQDIGLPEDNVPCELADGNSVTAPLYSGNLEIVGFTSFPAAIVVLGGEYVLGRGAIDRYEVIFDHGKSVIFKP